MVRLVVVFSATSEREAQKLLDGLRFLEPHTRLQTGCLACSNWREADLTLHHMEEWETEADIRYWLRTEAFRALLEMVEAAHNPTVQFDFVATSRGLDYVAEVRGDFGTYRRSATTPFEE